MSESAEAKIDRLCSLLRKEQNDLAAVRAKVEELIALNHEIADRNNAIETLNEELERKLPCGHSASLLIKSVESDNQFCELCEMRSQRDDAVEMETHYQARAIAAETKSAPTTTASCGCAACGVVAFRSMNGCPAALTSGGSTA